MPQLTVPPLPLIFLNTIKLKAVGSNRKITKTGEEEARVSKEI